MPLAIKDVYTNFKNKMLQNGIFLNLYNDPMNFPPKHHLHPLNFSLIAD